MVLPLRVSCAANMVHIFSLQFDKQFLELVSDETRKYFFFLQKKKYSQKRIKSIHNAPPRAHFFHPICSIFAELIIAVKNSRKNR